jgi:hypothetical protein
MLHFAVCFMKLNWVIRGAGWFGPAPPPPTWVLLLALAYTQKISRFSSHSKDEAIEVKWLAKGCKQDCPWWGIAPTMFGSCVRHFNHTPPLKPHFVRCNHFKVDDVSALEPSSKPPVGLRIVEDNITASLHQQRAPWPWLRPGCRDNVTWIC